MEDHVSHKDIPQLNSESSKDFNLTEETSNRGYRSKLLGVSLPAFYGPQEVRRPQTSAPFVAPQPIYTTKHFKMGNVINYLQPHQQREIILQV
jgi:hypothetical protein